MSLSTLGAQLAALSSSGGNSGNQHQQAGIIIPTNKKHQENIGRGINFNVQQGYNINYSVTNVKYKPSLIYESARAAADVPITTLRENAIDAIRNIQNHMLSSSSSLLRTIENKLLITTDTNNTPSANKKIIKKLIPLSLVLFSSLLPENNEIIITSTLHILEYMIRQFNIHVNYANELLWVFIPHIENKILTKYFVRCLELVDLSGSSGNNTFQSYLWLRPYAAAALTSSSSSSDNRSMTMPSRTFIAQQIIQNIHLIRTVCSISTTLATIIYPSEISSEHAENYYDGENSLLAVRDGIAHGLSYTAALLIEGLTFLMTVKNTSNKTNEQHAEAVLRTLLPTILRAINTTTPRNHCHHFTSWGYLLSSTITETMDLAPPTIALLTNKILLGVVDKQSNNSNVNSTISSIQLQSDALATILSILLQSTNNSPMQQQTMINDFVGIPLVNDKLLGCLLPTALWKNIVTNESKFQLASCLGYLYDDCQLIIEPFIVSILCKCIHHAQSSDDDDTIQYLIQSLLTEPKLKPVFTQHTHIDLVASLTSYLVTCYSTSSSTKEDDGNNNDKEDYSGSKLNQTKSKNVFDENGNRPVDLQYARFVLKLLHELDPSACERGLCIALQRFHKLPTDTNKSFAEKTKQLIQDILVVVGQKATEDDNGMDVDDDEEEEGAAKIWKLLPVRVAMDHENESIRLQAIERLIRSTTAQHSKTGKGDDGAAMSKEKEDGDDDDDDDDDDDSAERKDTLSSLESSILLLDCLTRRWAKDSSIKVSLAACKGLTELFENNYLSPGDGDIYEIISPDNVRTALTGCYRSILKSIFQHEEEQQTELLCHSIKTIAYIAQYVAKLGSSEYLDLWQVCVEFIAAHLSSSNHGSHNSAVRNAAVKALFIAFDDEETYKNKKTLNDATYYLMGKNVFIHGLEKNFSKNIGIDGTGETELSLRLRCFWVILQGIMDHHKKKSKNGSILKYAFPLCLSMISKSFRQNDDTTKLSNHMVQLLISCIEMSIAMFPLENDNVPDVLIQLASIPSDVVYRDAVVPIAQIILNHVRVAENKKEKVSPILILMETVLRPINTKVSKLRLIHLAIDLVTTETDQIMPWNAILPCLVLLEDIDESVRSGAIQLLNIIDKSFTSKQLKEARLVCLKSVCHQVSLMKSSAVVGGSSFLCNFLSALVRNAASNDVSTLQETLIMLCVWSTFSAAPRSVTTMTADSISTSTYWVSPRSATGGSYCSSKILNAMELSSENSFPLLLRWKYAGKPIIQMVLKRESFIDLSPSVLECAVRMLKGVIISDPRIIISSGPRSGGGRVRSYSVGKTDGVTVITPYPRDMLETVVEILMQAEKGNLAARILGRIVAKEILLSKSWGNEVFKKLPKAARKTVSSSIVRYISSDPDDTPGNISISLPFDSNDVIELLTDMGDTIDLAHESLLVDFIHSNAETMANTGNYAALSSALFDHLVSLHSISVDFDDIVEYLQHSILVTISHLLSVVFSRQEKLKLSTKTADIWIRILVNIVRSDGVSDEQKATNTRFRYTAMTLFVQLCSHFPKQGLPHMIPATISAISMNGTVSDESNASIVLSLVIPIFWKHAALCGLSFTSLLFPFIAVSDTVQNDFDRKKNYKMFTEALVSSSKEGFSKEQVTAQIACVSSVQAFYLANEALKSNGEPLASDHISFAVDLTRNMSGSAQMTSLLLLLHYVKDLVEILRLRSDYSPSELSDLLSAGTGLIPTPVDVANVAMGTVGSRNTSDYNSRILTAVTRAIMQVFSECLVMESVQRCIRKGDDSTPLQLWQELLVVESVARIAADNGDLEGSQLRDHVLRLLNQNHDYLQSVLPARVFLSSVSSLITEECSAELSSRALRLVADKVIILDQGYHEITLFVDLLPSILSLIEKSKPTEEVTEKAIVLKQSCLVAVEHIGRAFMGHKEDIPDSHRKIALQHFIASLKCCSKLLQHFSQSTMKATSLPSTNDIISSSALCAATLVRVVGAKCVQLLPLLMKHVFSELTYVNKITEITDERDSGKLESCKLVQLSLLRTLSSVVETVPQFLPPYLPQLFSSSCLFSEALRLTTTDVKLPMHAALQFLDAALSISIPFRLLVPPLTKSLSQCSDPNKIKSLLFILKMSIKQAAASDLSAQRNIILNSMKQTMDINLPWDRKMSFLESAGDVFDELILKVSEIQLRRMYASLKDWKGELDPNEPGKGAQRRYAFWMLSVRLSKALRSIFLPCLDMAFDDLVKELDHAVSVMCKQVSLKKAPSGQKRQRLALDDAHQHSLDSMCSLLPVLLCLEESLRADAKEGVNWVRADENHKYETLLGPLGKLMLCRVPVDFRVPENARNGYQHVVEGTGLDGGNIVGCLTALAAAGGDEQLWKPLNHAVLRACEEETRVECRRAGLNCLLSLMKTLGEEYMVLLPEILPVLAELLEDPDEEVAGLGKEVVTLAEELTGENLEDSLR